MLVILPLLAYVGSLIVLSNLRPYWDWRKIALRTTILLSIYSVIVIEILSLFKAITMLSLAITWGLPALLIIYWLIRRARSKSFFVKSMWKFPLSWLERILIFCILIVILLTAMVAWFAPPNTGDSLTTHMSRVAHWTQEKSIGFYATGIEFQNYYPPFPGIVILHTYVLARGDQFANFVQWFAMLLSIIGVSLIAKDLGASRKGQIFAALFLVTLPMGIIQSSSTMTDYIVAALLIAVASESITITQDESMGTTLFFLSASTGLAILSKPTAFAYLLPFAIFNAIVILRKVKYKKFILSTMFVILIILMLNAGYFTRNISTYGNPFGRPDRVAKHSNEVPLWKSLISNALRNASLHATTPFPAINYQIYRGILAIHVKLGMDIVDPRTSIHPVFVEQRLSTSEVTTGNTLHAVLLIVLTIIIFIKRRVVSKWVLPYMFTTIATFLVLSVAYKFSIFGSRYHVSFFALYSPIVGLVFDRFFPRSFSGIAGGLLVVLSWPWLLSLSPRPLLPLSQWSNRESVLTNTREEQYLPSEQLYETYFTISEMIKESGCTEVHLIFSGFQMEYPFWVYLGTPQNSIQIEWNIADTPSAQFSKKDFESCAVICDSSCEPSLKMMRGFPLVYESSGMRLFLSDKTSSP